MRFTRIVLTLILTCISVINYAATHTGKHGMVVSENALASQVGVDILRAGGNAIDAAVAVGYALAVVNPCCGNIGGGGFMTLHLADGKNIFINFREKAPLKAKKDMFLDKAGNLIPNATTKGYLAVAVPGTVMGLDAALRLYGTMTRKQVMAPAIKIAKEGYIVTPTEANWFAEHADDFRAQPSVAKIYLHDGKLYTPGERLIQTDLANTLTLIADKGTDAFYKGPIAQAIVAASNANGGILSMQDFADYTINQTKPITCQYRGYDIISAPPPSSGGITICEMLNILDNFPLKQYGFHTANSAHAIIEAMRYGFTDRNSKLGDPDFVSNPIAELTSKKYALALSKKIKSTTHVEAKKIVIKHELTDTTHYSVADGNGNAVAVTYTINGFFGALVIADHTGFFLNDEMDDFAAKPGESNNFGLVQNEKNSIQPGKRPLSSMSPTIIMKDGHVFMIVGSPGGPRIITSVLQTILNVIDYGMNIQSAVDAPRFHYQAEPDVVNTEPLAFSPLTTAQLKNMGYQLLPQHTWSAVEAIVINPTDGSFSGANDKRRPDGAAIGY